MENLNKSPKVIPTIAIGKAKTCISLFIALIFLLPASTYAQADIHFSQFYETSILRNPALTGVFENDYKVGAYFRSQWSSITNPYQTALVSAEYRISVSKASNDYISFGLLGYTDKAGQN